MTTQREQRSDVRQRVRVVRTRAAAPVIWLIFAVPVFAALAVIIANDPSMLHSSGSTSLADALQPQIEVPLRVFARVVLSLWAAVLALVVAVGVLRWRLALDVIVVYAIGLGASFVCTLLLWGPVDGVVTTVALAFVLGPSLPKRWRRAVWLVVAVAVIIEGALVDPRLVVLGASFVLGIIAGATTQLVLGRRTPTVTPEGVRAALASSGLPVASLTAIQGGPFGARVFSTEIGDRPLLVRVDTPGARGADWLTKLGRRIWLRGRAQPVFATPALFVAHQAFLAQLARNHGVRAPQVVGATVAGTGEALSVEERVAGPSLAASDPDMLTDDVLDDAWRTVAALHSGRIAHRDLRLEHFILDPEGRLWLTEYAMAEFGVDQRTLAMDSATLLVSLSLVIGAERSVASFARVVEPEARHETLRVLTKPALVRPTRKALGRDRQLLDDVRTSLAATIDADPDEVEHLNRFELRTLIQVVGAGVAMYLLLPQLANFEDTIRAWQDAIPWLLALAAVLSVSTYFVVALQLKGAVPLQIPYLWTVLVPISAEFANRVTPGGVGGIAVQGGYLRKQGASQAEATVAVTLTVLSGLLVNIPVLLLLIVILGGSGAPTTLEPPDIPLWVVLLVAGGVLVGAIVTLSLPAVRRRIRSFLTDSGTALQSLLRRPLGALMLFGGSFLLLAAYTGCFLVCLAAFEVDLPVVTAMTIYIAGSSLGLLVPTPGGVGGVEAVLIAGLTGAGVSGGEAVAVTLTFRLLTYWIPILPSVVTYRLLQRANRI